jgi:hypothetical protein
MKAALEPLVLMRTELPVPAIDLLVQRKRARRMHVVYWNPLLRQLEPMCCSRCGNGALALAFTDEEVAPLCAACSRLMFIRCQSLAMDSSVANGG